MTGRYLVKSIIYAFKFDFGFNVENVPKASPIDSRSYLGYSSLFTRKNLLRVTEFMDDA